MIMSTITMFVNLMVAIVALKVIIIITTLPMIIAHIFTTLKCAIMTKKTVATTQELLMVFVMTSTTIDFVILMEEIAALETRIQAVALSANVSTFLM